MAENSTVSEAGPVQNAVPEPAPVQQDALPEVAAVQQDGTVLVDTVTGSERSRTVETEAFQAGGVDRSDPAALEEGVMPAAAVAQASPEAANASAPRQSFSFRRMMAMLCMYNHPARLTMHYPLRFSILVCAILALSLAWMGNFFFSVLPLLKDESVDIDCRYALNQLKYNARVLFVYFIWFCIARISLFVPCILARVARVQSRTHGFCRTYCVHLVVRDGPIYMFVVGSVLFWFNILRSPECEERRPTLYQTLKLYAVFSCVLATLCVIVAYWHNKLIASTLDFNTWFTEANRSSPPDTVIKLKTRRWTADEFGEEEGKSYPTECAICLQTWDPDDAIKVTPCGHAFHEACIGGWLQTARTCALCRKDLVVLTEDTETPVPRSALQPESQTFGVSGP